MTDCLTCMDALNFNECFDCTIITIKPAKKPQILNYVYADNQNIILTFSTNFTILRGLFVYLAEGLTLLRD